MCILLANGRSSKEAKAIESDGENDRRFESPKRTSLEGPGVLRHPSVRLPDFRVAHLVRDTPILAEARKRPFV